MAWLVGAQTKQRLCAHSGRSCCLMGAARLACGRELPNGIATRACACTGTGRRTLTKAHAPSSAWGRALPNGTSFAASGPLAVPERDSSEVKRADPNGAQSVCRPGARATTGTACLHAPSEAVIDHRWLGRFGRWSLPLCGASKRCSDHTKPMRCRDLSCNGCALWTATSVRSHVLVLLVAG